MTGWVCNKTEGSFGLFIVNQSGRGELDQNAGVEITPLVPRIGVAVLFGVD